MTFVKEENVEELKRIATLNGQKMLGMFMMGGGAILAVASAGLGLVALALGALLYALATSELGRLEQLMITKQALREHDNKYGIIDLRTRTSKGRSFRFPEQDGELISTYNEDERKIIIIETEKEKILLNLKKIEERYVLGDITKQQYDEFSIRFSDELKAIEVDIENIKKDVQFRKNMSNVTDDYIRDELMGSGVIYEVKDESWEKTLKNINIDDEFTKKIRTKDAIVYSINRHNKEDFSFHINKQYRQKNIVILYLDRKDGTVWTRSFVDHTIDVYSEVPITSTI